MSIGSQDSLQSYNKLVDKIVYKQGQYKRPVIIIIFYQLLKYKSYNVRYSFEYALSPFDLTALHVYIVIGDFFSFFFTYFNVPIYVMFVLLETVFVLCKCVTCI